jgi:hypothetical protein
LTLEGSSNVWGGNSFWTIGREGTQASANLKPAGTDSDTDDCDEHVDLTDALMEETEDCDEEAEEARVAW